MMAILCRKFFRRFRLLGFDEREGPRDVGDAPPGVHVWTPTRITCQRQTDINNITGDDAIMDAACSFVG